MVRTRLSEVPSFNPHDLRHRRVSPARSGALLGADRRFVGHGDLVTTASTYAHVLGDEAEFDYLKLLA
jgi:integrase